MHELGIAQEIITIAEEYLPENETPVKSVKVRIGKLSNVLIDSLLFSYDAIITDTRLKDSELIVEETPIRLKCNQCGSEREMDDIEFLCPNCASNNIEVIGGTELEILEIELKE